MSVQLASLEILEEARFSHDQARAIIRVVESETSARREDLSTKSDVMAAKTELRTEITGVRTELKTDIADLRTELKADISGLKIDMVELGSTLRKEIHASAWRLIGVVAGQTGVMFGMMYFFATHIVR